MNAAIEVRVKDLRQAINHVLDQIEAKMGPVIDLDADYYWVPDPVDVYDVLSDARAPTMIGQLSDDVQSIGDILRDGQEYAAIWHDLAHINGVLARLAALDMPPGSR